MKIPDHLPPGGACFGVVLAFVLQAVRSYYHQLSGAGVASGEEAANAAALSQSIALRRGLGQKLSLLNLANEMVEKREDGKASDASQQKARDDAEQEDQLVRTTGARDLHSQIQIAPSSIAGEDQLVRTTGARDLDAQIAQHITNAHNSTTEQITHQSPSLQHYPNLAHFRTPNVVHRTLQAVFEASIHFDKDRRKAIGEDYARIMNGLARVLGFGVGVPKVYYLQDVEDVGRDVFGKMQDGIFIFTIGKDGDQHATGVLKSKSTILFLEPNQGLLLFDISAAHQHIRPFLKVYETLAHSTGPQRHRGKLYPLLGGKQAAEGNAEVMRLMFGGDS